MKGGSRDCTWDKMKTKMALIAFHFKQRELSLGATFVQAGLQEPVKKVTLARNLVVTLGISIVLNHSWPQH